MISTKYVISLFALVRNCVGSANAALVALLAETTEFQSVSCYPVSCEGLLV